MTSISEFERQKQERIKIVKDLIKHGTSLIFEEGDYGTTQINEKQLSLLVRRILEEIDKV